MVRTARHADQIAGFHFDREDRAVAGVDVEQAPAFDDEPHFVLVVPMLAAELREHDVEVRRLRLDVDHVRRHVAAPRLQRVDLAPVGGQQRVSGRVRRHGLRGRPSLVLDTVFREERLDGVSIAERQVLGRDLDDGHDGVPPAYCGSRGFRLQAEVQLFDLLLTPARGGRRFPGETPGSRRGGRPRAAPLPKCTTHAAAEGTRGNPGGRRASRAPGSPGGACPGRFPAPVSIRDARAS